MGKSLLKIKRRSETRRGRTRGAVLMESGQRAHVPDRREGSPATAAAPLDF